MFRHKAEKVKKCPLLRKPCIQHDCEWYSHLRGKDPQSEAEIDHFGCAIAWLPVVVIEGTQQTRQASADIQSFRNGVIGTLERFVDRMVGSALPSAAPAAPPRLAESESADSEEKRA